MMDKFIIFLLKSFLYFYSVCANIRQVCGTGVDAYCVHILDTVGVQKRALNPLELELYAAVSWNVGARR